MDPTEPTEPKVSKRQRFYYRHREEILAKRKADREADPMVQQKRAERAAALEAKKAETAAAREAAKAEREAAKKAKSAERARLRCVGLGLVAPGGDQKVEGCDFQDPI